MSSARGTRPAQWTSSMYTRKSPGGSRQQGYSLAELMVVLAIIGVLALVTIPNFISYYRSSQLKTFMGQFASDVRGARQKAATTYSLVMVSFDNGARPGRYRIFQSVDNGANWTMLKDRWQVNATPYFENGTFIDKYQSDGWPDIIFRRDGTADVPGSEGKMQIKIEAKYIKTSYELSVRSTGKVTTK